MSVTTEPDNHAALHPSQARAADYAGLPEVQAA